MKSKACLLHSWSRMTRLCVCAQDCGAEDYERWSPPQPNKCLMGRNITMERRRRSSDCFNGKEYERAETSSSTCQCTEVLLPRPHLRGLLTGDMWTWHACP